MGQRAPVKQEAPADVLASMNLGYNGYTDPTLTNPRQWIAGTNAFSGAFGYIQRARFANVVVGGTPVATVVAGTGGASTTATTVTINTVAAHGLTPGQTVIIYGVNINQSSGATTTVNGTFVVATTPSATQFTYNGTFIAGLLGGGGSVYLAYPAQSLPFTTLKYFALPSLSTYLMGDSNGKLWSFNAGANYLPQQRFNPYVDPQGFGVASLNGPWSREALQNILYEMNGTVKQAGRGANAATVEGFGLDAPDVSPQVVISAGSSQTITNIQRNNGTVTVTLAGALTVPGGNGIGMVNVAITAGDASFNGTFVVLTGSGTATLTWAQSGLNTTLLTPTGTVNVSITKSVGRSYAYAWENANKSHVGAPSPVTQFIAYAAQNGQVQCIEQGTAQTTLSSTNVVGTGTAFTSAWVGRSLYVNGNFGPIASVQSATQLTLLTAAGGSNNNNFQVFDPQATHIRLYETADGGATYFRTQRNAFNPNVALASSGLVFFDNAQAEPPNFPFTTEVSQLYNVPPPVGAFLKEYQGRLLTFGGTIPGQTFFFTNVESTTTGLPQESCAPLNQVTLPIQNANISGMADLPGSLIIWSDKHDMFRLTGLLSDNTPLGLGATNTASGLGTQITALPYSLGCANPFAVVVTPLGAIWVTSNRELWLYTDKYAPRNIGRPIQDILSNILPTQMPNIRLTYYHSLNRNWVAIGLVNGAGQNNVLINLDLDLLASNGQPSFFTFDMATNHPAFWVYSINCPALEVVYESGGNVRLLTGSTDLIQDADYQTGLFGTEIPVAGAGFTTHAWGNDSAPVLKRPTWLRFNTNRDPSVLANETVVGISSISRSANLVTVTTTAAHGLVANQIAFVAGVTDITYNGTQQVNTVPTATSFTYIQKGSNSSSSGGTVSFGWSFAARGIDDDFYTFNTPLTLNLTPGVNDTSSLCGNPNLSSGEAFRHSPELFRIGGVNFVMGRRIQFQVNFPSGTGVNYAFRSIQIGFGPTPPR